MDAGGEQRQQQQQQLRRLLSMYVRRNEEGEEGRQLLYSAVSCSPLGTRTFGRILGAAAECRLTAASPAPSTPPCCPFLPCPAGLGRLSRLRLAQLKEKRGGTNACATCNAMAKRICRTRPRRGKRKTNFPLLSLALMRDKCKSWRLRHGVWCIFANYPEARASRDVDFRGFMQPRQGMSDPAICLF